MKLKDPNNELSFKEKAFLGATVLGLGTAAVLGVLSRMNNDPAINREPAPIELTDVDPNVPGIQTTPVDTDPSTPGIQLPSDGAETSMPTGAEAGDAIEQMLPVPQNQPVHNLNVQQPDSRQVG